MGTTRARILVMGASLSLLASAAGFAAVAAQSTAATETAVIDPVGWLRHQRHAGTAGRH